MTPPPTPGWSAMQYLSKICQMPLKRLKISPARCVNRTVWMAWVLLNKYVPIKNLFWWTNVMNDNNCWCGEKLNSPGSLICSRFQSKLLRFWRFPDWNDWLTNKKRNTRKVRSRMKAGWNLLCLRKLKYYLNSATTNNNNNQFFKSGCNRPGLWTEWRDVGLFYIENTSREEFN